MLKASIFDFWLSFLEITLNPVDLWEQVDSFPKISQQSPVQSETVTAIIPPNSHLTPAPQ